MDQWRPIWEIAFGVGTLIASLMIHGVGMFYVQRRNRDFRTLPPLGLRREAAFSLLILVLVFTHVIEVLVWSIALLAIGALPNLRDAYYYVAVTYTTLGYAEGTLTPQWRILAPMMAMSGVFAFGWTTSVLFAIVGMQYGAIDTASKQLPPPG
ncbi:MAG TPA: ion channel [Casimicrobiaceae bacterium]